MMVDSSQVPKYKQPKRQWCSFTIPETSRVLALQQKHGDGVLLPPPASQGECPAEKSLDFHKEQSLQSPVSLLKANTQMHKPILGLKPYRHLQTAELIFGVRLRAQVNISFWYLKQPHRKDRIWADLCSSCLQSAANNTGWFTRLDRQQLLW